MNPQPITGKQVWHLADGQSQLAPFYMDIYFGPGKIKGLTGGA
jgi:hypothetical protein